MEKLNFEVWAAPVSALVVLVVMALLWANTRRRARQAAAREAGRLEAIASADRLVAGLNRAAIDARLAGAGKRPKSERRERVDVDNAQRRRADTDDYPHHQASVLSDPGWPAPVARASSWMADHSGDGK